MQRVATDISSFFNRERIKEEFANKLNKLHKDRCLEKSLLTKNLIHSYVVVFGERIIVNLPLAFWKKEWEKSEKAFDSKPDFKTSIEEFNKEFDKELSENKYKSFAERLCTEWTDKKCYIFSLYKSSKMEKKVYYSKKEDKEFSLEEENIDENEYMQFISDYHEKYCYELKWSDSEIDKSNHFYLIYIPVYFESISKKGLFSYYFFISTENNNLELIRNEVKNVHKYYKYVIQDLLIRHFWNRVKSQALKSGIAAIMSRNLSHIHGSHIEPGLQYRMHSFEEAICYRLRSEGIKK